LGIQINIAEITVGGDTMLSCNNPADVVWMFRAEKIEEKSLIKRSGKYSNLFLQKVNYEHYGVFHCVEMDNGTLLLSDVLVKIFGKYLMIK